MTNKPMLSVDRELLEDLHSHPDCPVEFIDHLRRTISQPDGNAFKRCTILKECNVKSLPASGARINAIAKPITRRVCHGCVGLPRDVFCPVCNDEQPAPVADHTQCEECKGWGYHENHHEGGGTECGECGGSGNASVAMFMPDVDELAQIIRKVADSHNLGAGSLAEAILEEVARLNGLKP